MKNWTKFSEKPPKELGTGALQEEAGGGGLVQPGEKKVAERHRRSLPVNKQIREHTDLGSHGGDETLKGQRLKPDTRKNFFTMMTVKPWDR